MHNILSCIIIVYVHTSWALCPRPFRLQLKLFIIELPNTYNYDAKMQLYLTHSFSINKDFKNITLKDPLFSFSDNHWRLG